MDNIVVSLKAILSKKNRQKDIKMVETFLQDIRKRETNILVCGEFKRGKSSFINAFLEQNLCPVDTDIATAAVSVIRYGEKVKIIRQYGDFSHLESEELYSLADIERYAKGKAEDIDNTVLLEIEVPNEKLKSGIVLMDTPGIGGLDPRHAFLTNYYMPRADITLFVTDKDAPMSAPEIQFFEKNIASYSRQCAVLINKADLFESEEKKNEWVADVQNKCKGAKTAPQVIPVSAKLKVRYLDGKEERYLSKSNFETVEKEIAALSETVRANLMLELKKLILDLLDEIHKPLQMQVEQIEFPDPRRIEKLEKDSIEYKKQKMDYENPNSEFRRRLNQELKQAKNEVEYKLEKETMLLSTDTIAQLAKSPEARNPQWLMAQFNNCIGSVASELDMIIDATFEEIALKMGMDFSLSEQRRFYFSIDDISIETKSFGSKMNKMLRTGMGGVGVGTALSLLLSPFIGIPVGIWTAWKAVKDASTDESEAEIKAALSPKIMEARLALRKYISEKLDDFNELFIAAIQQKTQRIIENLQETINLQTALKAESAQKQQLKSKLLAEELKPVDNLIAVTKAFLNNPFEKR
jgi:GTPase Era involved in 16S rRNA processing